MIPQDCLAALPDLTDWTTFAPWVEQTLERIAKNKFAANLNITPLPYVDIAPAQVDPVLGLYGSPEWRRFAVGAFLADWACYTKPADRCDFTRFLSVFAAFPQGFRLYFAPLQDGTPVPVGYTGWYPILEDVFARLEKNPEQVTNRGMMTPIKTMSDEGDYFYMFNFSIIPPMIRTRQSAMLIKDFAKSIEHLPKKGAAAVTVSEHGIRVSKRFGLEYTGQMTHEGDSEGVYCARFQSSSQLKAKTA